MEQNKTWRETRINIAANVVRSFSEKNTKPNYFLMVNNTASVIYVGANPNVSDQNFDLIIPALGSRVYARPDSPAEIYFYSTNDSVLYIGSMQRAFDPSMITQTQEISSVAASGLLGLVSVKQIFDALPAGTNAIGTVGVTALPALPAGDNNIGNVDVVTLPALPAGDNNIGNVDVVTLPDMGTGKIADLKTIMDLFAYATASNTSTGAAITQSLDKGFRIKTGFIVTTDTASTFTIAVSLDNAAWFDIDTIVMSGAGNGYKMIEIPARYVKISNATAGNHTVKISSGGF